ncbi:MAG: hypothetical protein ABSG41_05890 [Bryobacteraceae bacterium]|jgi:hypothetical protein
MTKQTAPVLSDLPVPHLKTPLWQYVRTSSLPVILTVPVIYACIIPFMALDLALTIYQLICFPAYGIPKVRRSDYLIFDRGRLAYLNAIEKVHCVYCSYGNGVLAYVAEIAARTEQRFCPIRHAQDLRQEHSRYRFFLPHGDAHAYRTQGERVASDWDDLREWK